MEGLSFLVCVHWVHQIYPNLSKWGTWGVPEDGNPGLLHWWDATEIQFMVTCAWRKASVAVNICVSPLNSGCFKSFLWWNRGLVLQAVVSRTLEKGFLCDRGFFLPWYYTELVGVVAQLKHQWNVCFERYKKDICWDLETLYEPSLPVTNMLRDCQGESQQSQVIPQQCTAISCFL